MTKYGDSRDFVSKRKHNQVNPWIPSPGGDWTKIATIYDSIRGGMICIGRLSVEPGTIGANSTEEVECELPGAMIGDIIELTPPHTIDDDLVFLGADVTGEDEVTVKVQNVSAGELTFDAKAWNTMILITREPACCPGEDEDVS